MKPSIAWKEKQNEVKKIFAKYPKFSNIRVFGSVARGEDTENSDIDLYVDAAYGTGIHDLNKLRANLMEVLGIPVDIIISGNDIHPILRICIEEDITGRKIFIDRKSAQITKLLEDIESSLQELLFIFREENEQPVSPSSYFHISLEIIIYNLGIIGQIMNILHKKHPVFCEEHPEILSEKIIAIHEQIVHNHANVDWKSVSDILKNDIQPLLENTKKLAALLDAKQAE